MNISRSLMLLCSAAFFATSGMAVAGTAVSVDQNVHITRASAAGLMGPGTTIRTGDLISVDQNGLAQVAFPDGTRIVIGPNTTLRLEEYSRGAQGQVQRVRLNATRGSVRFVAGSNISAYSVQTPGGLVRPQSGVVDVAAGGARGAYVVTLGGEALMCDAHHKCTLIRGDCTFASAIGAGGFGLASTNSRERRRLLQELFPNIVNQSRLVNGFEADVRACGFLGAQRSPAQVSAGRVSTPTPPGTSVPPTTPPTTPPGQGGSGGGGAAAAAASGGGSGGGGAAAAAAGSAAAAAAAGGSGSGTGSGGGAAAAAAGGGGTSTSGAAASASSSPSGAAAAAASTGGTAASATGN